MLLVADTLPDFASTSTRDMYDDSNSKEKYEPEFQCQAGRRALCAGLLDAPTFRPFLPGIYAYGERWQASVQPLGTR